VRIAVLGLGFMGSMHLKWIMRDPRVQLAAVASEIPAQLTGDLSSVKGNIGGPGEVYDFSQVRKYTDPFEAVQDPHIEAVDICLPTNLHRDVAVAALRAGKHVLLEKPMALDGGDTDKILAEARQSGGIFMVAHVVRFFGAYRVLREWLRSGRLGAIRSAVFRRRCPAPAASKWIYNKAISGGGAFDLLIHDVDQCISLFGLPETLAADGYEDMPAGIDQLSGHLYYRDIGSVTVMGGWHHRSGYPFAQEFTVSADGGTLEYSSAGRPLALYGANGTAEQLPVPEMDGYRAELEYFLECCESGRAPELCPPEESGLAVKLTALLVEVRKKRGEKLPVDCT
jgi:predicted dehydrogenase